MLTDDSVESPVHGKLLWSLNVLIDGFL